MIFSLRQLQEKCREQNQPLYLAFIDLTKAFDLVSRDGLFKMLPIIGCPPKLLSLIRSFHEGMLSTVQFVGDISKAFGIKSGVKQGCVLAPTLFGSSTLQVEDKQSHSQRLAFCRRRNYCLSYSGWLAATNGPFVKRM